MLHITTPSSKSLQSVLCNKNLLLVTNIDENSIYLFDVITKNLDTSYHHWTGSI